MADYLQQLMTGFEQGHVAAREALDELLIEDYKWLILEQERSKPE